jgi:hypothetical protein
MDLTKPLTNIVTIEIALQVVENAFLTYLRICLACQFCWLFEDDPTLQVLSITGRE